MVTHVLVHGFAGSPASWAAVIPRLDGDCVAPALPGHNSPALASFDAYVEWLARYIEGVPRPLHFVGYSAGARLVAGALVKGVPCDMATLISVNLGLTTEPERRDRLAADAGWSALLREQGIAAFVDAWETQPVFESQRQLPAADRHALRLERERLDPFALADTMDALSLGKMPDFKNAMRALALPWQLVAGRRDQKFLELARGLGAAHVCELDCGHNPILEDPKGLAARLNEFVRARVSPPSH
jgi:2-succinyl-6-hydroxy-2,4-cyclohexadiene-1-carboxylate synthase